MNYYNEIDPYAADFLENLIFLGEIPDGIVDRRSIEDVTPADLAGYTQCHFFAGVGGWALALKLADWPEDRPVWTGSCPCQPFSAAGKGAGFADERHLWPAWEWLIRQCRPAAVFGEQVASKDVDPWIDLVLTDLEGLDYAGGAIAFPSASIGAPHIRDRTYWVGYANDARLEGLGGGYSAAQGQRQEPFRPAAEASGAVRMANSASRRRGEECANSGGCVVGDQAEGLAAGPERGSGDHGTGPTNGIWRDADWLHGRDEKWRPVEPGTFPLAYGVSGRVGRLRAYGNAINPWQAAEFILSAEEAKGMML